MSRPRIIKEYHPSLTPEAGEMVERIAGGFLPADAEVIYEGRNTLWRCEIDGRQVIVKKFRRPNVINRLVYTTFRQSKAHRSFSNALKLLGLGFATPQPLAYAEVRRGLLLGESYYICEVCQGDEMRWWERRPDVEPLLKDFGADIARLHNAGVWHKDFSPGNILATRHDDGHYTFSYIDLNRMAFGVTNHKKLMSMFGTLNEEEEVSRLARYYALAAGIDPDIAASEAAQAYRSFIRRVMCRRSLKRLFKNCFRWKR